MTREQLDALEKLYLERSDSLDASSYGIQELIAAARRALELEEALDWIRSDPTVSLSYSWQRQWTVHRRFRGTICDLGEGATPLESVRNAMGGKV